MYSSDSILSSQTFFVQYTLSTLIETIIEWRVSELIAFRKISSEFEVNILSKEWGSSLFGIELSTLNICKKK